MAVYVAQYCWPADYCIGKLQHTWQITGQTEVDCTLFLSLPFFLYLRHFKPELTVIVNPLTLMLIYCLMTVQTAADCSLFSFSLLSV